MLLLLFFNEVFIGGMLLVPVHLLPLVMIFIAIKLNGQRVRELWIIAVGTTSERSLSNRLFSELSVLLVVLVRDSGQWFVKVIWLGHTTLQSGLVLQLVDAGQQGICGLTFGQFPMGFHGSIISIASKPSDRSCGFVVDAVTPSCR